jgi:two-component system chemotaxis response regulator CheY
VLAVGDSPVILGFLKDLLGSEGYEVETATNGAQALDRYHYFKPDIVTLDLSMPVMDGYEVLTRLLRLDPRVQVVMLTGMEQSELMQRCLGKGAAGYIVKPFDGDRLLAALKNLHGRTDGSGRLFAFFSRIADIVDHSVKRMLDQNTSFALTDVKLVQENRRTSTFSDFEVAHMGYAMEVREPLDISPQAKTTCYVSAIGGQRDGLVATMIKDGDLAIMSGIAPDGTALAGHPSSVEFFHTIHTKVVSMLAETSQLRIQLGSTKLYDKATDRGIVPSASAYAEAAFEIKFKGLRLPMEMQLWFDTSLIFRNS